VTRLAGRPGLIGVMSSPRFHALLVMRWFLAFRGRRTALSRVDPPRRFFMRSR
jgi:hypothetical protein